MRRKIHRSNIVRHVYHNKVTDTSRHHNNDEILQQRPEPLYCIWWLWWLKQNFFDTASHLRVSLEPDVQQVVPLPKQLLDLCPQLLCIGRLIVLSVAVSLSVCVASDADHTLNHLSCHWVPSPSHLKWWNHNIPLEVISGRGAQIFASAFRIQKVEWFA